MKKIVATVALLAFFVGCASTGIVQTDPDAFMVSKQSAMGVLGTPYAVQADIYAEANAFCARSGKGVETISTETKGAVPFVRTGSASLRFRCVSGDQQGAR